MTRYRATRPSHETHLSEQEDRRAAEDQCAGGGRGIVARVGEGELIADSDADHHRDQGVVAEADDPCRIGGAFHRVQADLLGAVE
jgi:hypothetical protein